MEPRSAIVGLVVVTACRFPPLPDLPLDATSPCDPVARFGAPVPIAGLARPDRRERFPRLSSDELELYFSSAPATGGDEDLYVVRRTSRLAPFGEPAALTTLNSGGNDGSPSIAGDGLTLWFSSDRVPGQGWDIH